MLNSPATLFKRFPAASTNKRLDRSLSWRASEDPLKRPYNTVYGQGPEIHSKSQSSVAPSRKSLPGWMPKSTVCVDGQALLVILSRHKQKKIQYVARTLNQF